MHNGLLTKADRLLTKVQATTRFKGMEILIHERGLWPEKGLNAQCEGFKCVVGKTDCCCCRLLFTQPDFANQKSHLEEYITSRGHISDYYPKYHCELNFIEQYLLGDAPHRPMSPPIYLRHLCIFLLIVASPRRSALAAPILESEDHVT